MCLCFFYLTDSLNCTFNKNISLGNFIVMPFYWAEKPGFMKLRHQGLFQHTSIYRCHINQSEALHTIDMISLINPVSKIILPSSIIWCGNCFIIHNYAHYVTTFLLTYTNICSNLFIWNVFRYKVVSFCLYHDWQHVPLIGPIDYQPLFLPAMMCGLAVWPSRGPDWSG